MLYFSLLLIVVIHKQPISKLLDTDNDEDKVKLLANFVVSEIEINICEMFLLVKPNGDATRTRKVIFQEKDIVNRILAKSKCLKDVLEGKAYIKPDKTKSERDEFTRFPKRKEQAEKEFPPGGEEDPSRVDG